MDPMSEGQPVCGAHVKDGHGIRVKHDLAVRVENHGGLRISSAL